MGSGCHGSPAVMGACMSSTSILLIRPMRCCQLDCPATHAAVNGIVVGDVKDRMELLVGLCY